jgi:hypothetical protein
MHCAVLILEIGNVQAILGVSAGTANDNASFFVPGSQD